MRSWPALDVGTKNGDVGAGFSRPELFQAALLDYSVAAVDETAADVWRVFFNTAADRDAAATGLAQQFPELRVQAVDVPDREWAARSQASLLAIRIGDIIVAPPWDVPPPGRLQPAPPTGPAPATDVVAAGFSRPMTIVIQPSMGFGTGHHATTRLCLAALQQRDLRGRRVLDVGTGSGVLAIAASRLGAAQVIAIDDDSDAIQAARENLVLNPGADVTLRVASLRSAAPALTLEPSDVVVANLTGGLLIQTASELRDLTAASAHVILSGFTRHEEADVLAAYSDLAIRARAEEDEWLCVTLQRDSARPSR